jgi:hypothetical protein
MRRRCNNPNQDAYKNYGARGIFVCSEWQSDFKVFHEWAMANGYQNSLTIERIDNEKGYSPDNCKWVTRKEQANNSRHNRLITYKGKTKTVAQWAEEKGINPKTLRKRLWNGWDVESALEQSVRS